MSHTDSNRPKSRSRHGESDNESTREGMPSHPPEGGLEKSVTVERQVPKPGKAVEKSMGSNMSDRR
jgi:hypothetical protein